MPIKYQPLTLGNINKSVFASRSHRVTTVISVYKHKKKQSCLTCCSVVDAGRGSLLDATGSAITAKLKWDLLKDTIRLNFKWQLILTTLEQQTHTWVSDMQLDSTCNLLEVLIHVKQNCWHQHILTINHCWVYQIPLVSCSNPSGLQDMLLCRHSLILNAVPNT